MTPKEWLEYPAVRARIEAGTNEDAKFILRAFRGEHYGDHRYKGEVPGVPPPVREAPFPGKFL